MALQAFGNSGRFFRGNLHTHSTRSDGKLAADEVCRFYRESGYDFIMLSDHFLSKYDFPVTDTRDSRTHDFTTILGAEIHAPATGHGDLWHILAAGLPLDFMATGPEESGPELARRAAEAGAFIGIAHPAWNGLSVEDARSIDAAHAVEIFNYGSALETDRGDGFYVLDAFLNENKRLSGYATDDAHFHTQDHGHAWVMVKAPTNEPENLVTALKRGDYYSSEGPEIHNIELKGDQLVVDSSPAHVVALVGRGCKSKHANSQCMTNTSLPAEQFADDWCRVIVMDDKGKRAWSNPIWMRDYA